MFKKLLSLGLVSLAAVANCMPLAPVTEKAFFNVEIDNVVVGKIVFGLYGETVPKTVKNFVEICKGGHYVKKRHHARHSKTGAFKTLDQLNYYFVELKKINTLESKITNV